MLTAIDTVADTTCERSISSSCPKDRTDLATGKTTTTMNTS